jgi:hypothetical protein
MVDYTPTPREQVKEGQYVFLNSHGRWAFVSEPPRSAGGVTWMHVVFSSGVATQISYAMEMIKVHHAWPDVFLENRIEEQRVAIDNQIADLNANSVRLDVINQYNRAALAQLSAKEEADS